jgi:hypothetical protein
VSDSLGRAAEPVTTDDTILRQIREHDETFRDAAPSGHQLVTVVFDNVISRQGDLTRRIKLVMIVGDETAKTHYTWRIPHGPSEPPFAIDVVIRASPLPYEVRVVEDDDNVEHTEIVIDLSCVAAGTTIEIRMTYSQDKFINIVRNRLFYTERTFVWSYTVISTTNYYETRATFPNGYQVRLNEGDPLLYRPERQRISEIDGRTVYSYTLINPPVKKRLTGRLTYRIWSPAVAPAVTVIASILVALPAGFASGLSTGLLTVAIALAASCGAYWLIKRLS